jgi:hypothetical protein
MHITTIYRYVWSGQEREILVVCEGTTVVCTDPADGDDLGTYTWSGSTLVGSGSLSQLRRDAIGALLVAVTAPGP